MAFPLIQPIQQFFDSSGSPLVSGTIEFRSPTTNSLIDTYPTAADADAQTNANDNPLTLNARGEPSDGIYLEDGVSYKVTLKDSSGATIWTEDNVLCPLSEIKYTVTSVETSAGVTPTDYYYEPGDIRRYKSNASPGTTDMASAITTALSIDYETIIPFEDFALTPTVTVTNELINGNGELICLEPGTAGDPMLDVTGANAVIENIKINQPSTSNQSRGIRSNGTYTTIFNVRFESNDKGDYPVFASGNQNGLRILNSFFDTADRALLWKPNIADPTSNTYSGRNLQFVGNYVVGNGTEGGISAASIDGNLSGGVIVGNIADNLQATTTTAISFGCANDGALLSESNCVVRVGNLSYQSANASFRTEDAMWGIADIANASTNCGVNDFYYLATTASGTPEGIMNIGCTTYATAGSVVKGVRESAAYDSLNKFVLIGSSFYNWGSNAAESAIYAGKGALNWRIIGTNLKDDTANNPSCLTYKGDRAVIAYNAWETGGDGIVIDETGLTNILIESNNSFSDVAGDLVATLTPTNAIIGDKSYMSKTFTSDAVSTVFDIVSPMRRAGFVTRVSILYEEDQAGTSSAFALKKTSDGTTLTTMCAVDAGTGANKAFTEKNQTDQFSAISDREFAAGDVLYLDGTTNGDTAFDYKIYVEWFEYS